MGYFEFICLVFTNMRKTEHNLENVSTVPPVTNINQTLRVLKEICKQSVPFLVSKKILYIIGGSFSSDHCYCHQGKHLHCQRNVDLRRCIFVEVQCCQL